MAKREKEHNAAVGPEHTSAAIFDALTNPKPLTRYACAKAIGLPGWLIVHMLRILPDRLIDFAFRVL